MHADTESPAWSVRLISELHAADQRANALAKTLTPQQLNWKPGPGEWSVGQCLEHLCVTNDVYLPPMSSSLAGRRLAVVSEITPGWFGRWFIRNYIEPSSDTRRARAPKKIAPGSEVEPSVLERFLSGNQSVRELVLRAGKHDVNRVRFKNPFIPVLRFTVGTGLEIVVRHQRRHLLQAERVRQRVEFPRA
jgi:DinB family protein